jgi:hypothetical protein
MQPMKMRDLSIENGGWRGSLLRGVSPLPLLRRSEPSMITPGARAGPLRDFAAVGWTSAIDNEK